MAEQDFPDVLEAALTRVHHLEQENLCLRNAADTFGLLAERLNRALQTERRVPAGPPDQTAQPAGVPPEPRTVALWHLGEWRCEYGEDHQSRTLRLYMGEQLVQASHARDMFETLRQSADWQGAVRSGPRDPGRGNALAATPDRRSGRRAVARGGRRTYDAVG